MPNGPHHLQPISKPSGRKRHDIILPDIMVPQDLPTEPVAIADMAERFGVTHRTLHFYEEKGLIEASRIGLMRVYQQGDIARMAVINVCREIGMPISVIQDLFELLASAKSKAEANLIFEDALSTRRRELAAGLSMVHRQLQQVNALLENEDVVGLRRTPKQASPELSEPEHSCLQLMAEGYTTIRIARILEMNIPEVEELEKTIVEKVGAQNRFQAVAKAVLLGIVVS
ncbi:MerR family transcriptional regulator [Rhizobium wuzhouense]|uniref:LuxR family transcriptional regulator n=1 Tax=Rhizobium wuzhouense TaxID=1986026 RepID=A0ABX5NTL6_9HYPH|nr:MerR family transcriptional regulator [Rhizobium wuzhouense]PYB75338.1 LuxR family transcriptional regulator [Rhizobium wuzhouense]